MSRQYPPHRQTVESNRIITTAAATAPHYHFESPSAASFTCHPPWFDDDWEDHNRTISRSSHQNNHTKRQRSLAVSTSNSQSDHQNERKRSRHDHNNEREEQYQSHHYQPYSNHRSTQIQATNPTIYHLPFFPRSFDYGSHFHHESSPVVSPHRQSIPSSSSRSPNTHHHRSGMTFESTSSRPPLFHQTSIATHMQQRPSPSFLLNDLLHRVVNTHAASYGSNHAHHHPPTASIDLIAYALMSPGHEIFSLPAAFSIPFGDFFDLILPDETPVVGLTDSELERLPSMICTKMKSDDKCTICLSEYINGEKLKRLKCKHYFHSECINPWLKTSTRCPICRSEQTS